MPWIEYNQEKVGGTEFIIDFLEERLGVSQQEPDAAGKGHVSRHHQNGWGAFLLVRDSWRSNYIFFKKYHKTFYWSALGCRGVNKIILNVTV